MIMSMGLGALIFDCDGVLADTERDGHRVAFNLAFQEQGIEEEWSVERYGKLLEIGGGKERMTGHWNEVGWPEGYDSVEKQQELVKLLHKKKTDLFMGLVEGGQMSLRPGVLRLVDEAIERGIPIAVCSTSNEKAVTAIVRVLMGSERANRIRIFAGDVVAKKKPAPDIYNLAKETLDLDPTRVVVVEDSHIGLTAAKAAGMHCIVTTSTYTSQEDFTKADAIYPDLDSSNVSLSQLDNVILKH